MGWGMYRPTYTCKKTGKTKRAKKFYLWWTTPLEKKTERIPLSAVKEIALAMADRIIKERELGRVALPLSRPSFLLSTSLSDWEASLRASGVKESGVKLKLARVRQLVDGCGFKTTDDLSASKVEQFLLELRKTRSVQTSNDWLQHTKQFALWLVAEGRLDKTPFARLRAGNAQADQRRGRRARNQGGAEEAPFRRTEKPGGVSLDGWDGPLFPLPYCPLHRLQSRGVGEISGHGF